MVLPTLAIISPQTTAFGLIVGVLFVIYLVRRLRSERKEKRSLTPPRNMPTNNHQRERISPILEIPSTTEVRTVPPRAENILEVPEIHHTPQGPSTAIIDVTGQTAAIPQSSGLVRYTPGVPSWAHHYVFSASELQQATQAQKAFYYAFRDAFVKGTCFDVEGNSNYVFILLFDLIDSFNVGEDLTALEKHLERLGEHYPKTRPYIRRTLYKRLQQVGLHSEAERIRGQDSTSSYNGGFDNDYWRFGNRHKKRLSLSADEVEVLNHLTNPSNNFLDIQFCCDQVIRLFLNTVKELDATYRREGSTLDVQFSEIADVILRKHYRYRHGSQNYRYMVRPTIDELYSLVFKHCENAVREHYSHKRKLSTDSYQASGANTVIEQRLTDRLPRVISPMVARLGPPDRDTEIELNSQNPNRWKVAFKELVESNNMPNGKEFAVKVRQLADFNQKNPSVENIYFEASKVASKFDNQTALVLYLHYLHCDLGSAKFDNRKFTKTVQKSLFSTNEQLREFEKVVSELISDRDIAKALRAVSGFYKPKRRQIKLNSSVIKETLQKHAGTVELLNEYLQDEFEDDQNVISAKEVGNEEIRLEITPKSSPDSLAEADLDVPLSDAQQDLLRLFMKNGLGLSRNELETFAREKGLFLNQLIESINDACYDLLDDLLIEEEDEGYMVSENYLHKIFPQ